MNLDLRKYFDGVDWTFLWLVLHKIGISFQVSKWIIACVSNIKFIILINGIPTKFFSTSQDLRQGCALSPLLSILFIGDLVSCSCMHRSLTMSLLLDKSRLLIWFLSMMCHYLVDYMFWNGDTIMVLLTSLDWSLESLCNMRCFHMPLMPLIRDVLALLQTSTFGGPKFRTIVCLCSER